MTSTNERGVASAVPPPRSPQFAKPDGQFNVLQLALQAALDRERVLIEEKHELSRRQSVLAQEFEHRLLNGLQLVISLLTLQSRATTSPEAGEQLALAAGRVSALGRVHRQLHQLDHRAGVEFKPYLVGLCEDLSELLLGQNADRKIVVEGPEIAIKTEIAIPLGFITNELVTNAVKYGAGDIVVRLEAQSPTRHSVSVLDHGPGLPRNFDPSQSKGLGMKILRSFAKQIGGQLQLGSGESGHEGFLAVSF
jgi:two-component sensor histidine kinase